MAAENGTQTKERAEEFIRALHALEAAPGDGKPERDALVKLFAEDATVSSAALRLAGEERTGREGAAHFWEEYKRTVGKGRSEFHAVTANGTSAGLFWRTAVSRDGVGASYDGATLLVFGDDGKITRFEGYYDVEQLNRAFGAC